MKATSKRTCSTFALGFVWLCLYACSAAPTAEAQPPTPEGQFASPIYGYTVTMPEGWRLSAPATRLMTHAEFPEAGFPQTDTFRGPERKNFMAVGAQPVSSSVTLEAWAEYAKGMTPDCERPPADRAQIEFAGQPALVVVDGACFGLDHLWLVLLHADRAFHIAWAGDRDKFEAMRATFAFTP